VTTSTAPEPSAPPVKKDWRFEASQAFMLLGLGGLLLFGFLASKGREPFATWFYAFAWWSYILFVDGWVYRHRQESLILSFPGRFIFLAAWSVVFWMFFEALNLRLQNWSYWNLPANPVSRWPGYILAFATVVPGLLETSDLIDGAGFIKEAKVKPLGWKKRVGPYFFAAGLLMLALPMAFPTLFFPLVWGSLIFLLEPLNERLGVASLVSDWRLGRLKRFYTLLLSGFFCGGLWECWNAIARAKWTYSIPGVDGGKIFEMPALGFLGFAPFAVEAFVATALVTSFWDKASKPVRALLIVFSAAFILGMCWALDHSTVRSFQS
jgi:hypothetical protein